MIAPTRATLKLWATTCLFSFLKYPVPNQQFCQVLRLLSSPSRPSSLASLVRPPDQPGCPTSPLALDHQPPLRRCRSERRSQSLGERGAALSRSLTERRGLLSKSRKQDVPRSPLQRLQAKFSRTSSLEVSDAATEQTKFTIPEIKLDLPPDE